jgi:hypothetical protein
MDDHEWGAEMIHTVRKAIASFLRGAEDGTAMTEFVAMTPIFILIFISILDIGALARQIPRNTANAVKKTFSSYDRSDASSYKESTNSFYEIQDQGRDGLMDALKELSVHDTAGTAAKNAISQVREYPAKQDSIIQTAITGLETNAYAAGLSNMGGGSSSIGGMARAGMWGEAVGRLAPIGLAGDYAYVMGAEEAITADPGQFFGSGDDGSKLAEALLYDGYRPKAATNLGCENAGILTNLLTAANSAISASGVRAPLAAGVTYGTVTGEEQTSGTIGGVSFDFQDYYTVSTPPRGYPATNGIATFLSRLAMENCKTTPAYIGLLGGGTEGMWGGQDISVPDAGEAGFTRPYNYDMTAYD